MSRGRNRHRRESTGQSLVEFALTLPILLFILLTIADFGRFFNAGISLESMARTSSEIAAQEYVRAPSPVDYTEIHRAAWSAVCDEGKSLPGVTYPTPGSECSGIATTVCVHDGVDPNCGSLYNDSAGIPANCQGLQSGNLPNNATASEAAGEVHDFVEVRVCYEFKTILDVSLPFFGTSLSPLSGTFVIERSRTFTVADY